MKTPVILLVDDEKFVLDSLKTELKTTFSPDYLIETAESGKEAIELLLELTKDNHDIPIIITDYIMPGMKGDELLRLAKSFLPNTLNIMLTGQADINAVANAVNNASLYRFITKPWLNEDLVLTIKEALQKYNLEKQINIQNEEIRELNQNLEKKVEERTNELVNALATKDKFFSIIAHDLKNPLSVMLFSVEILLEEIEEYSVEKVKEYVLSLHSGTKQISNLLLNLLEWARAHSGRMPFNPKEHVLCDIISDNIKLLENSLTNKSIKTELLMDNDLKCFADINMLNTVLRNLISNAIKFSNNDSKISVKTYQDNDFICIEIHDEGVGIPDDKISKLFNVGSHFSTKGTNKETGTGLGLLICKEFMNIHHGDILVNSEMGKGSFFTVKIPINHPA